MNNPQAIKNSFNGVWVDSLTPIKEDLHIDLHRLESHLRTLMMKGVQGVVLFGFHGEGPSFSSEEKAEAISYLLKAGVAPSSLVLSISSNAAPDALKLAHFAQKAHLHGVLISAPSHYKSLSNLGLTQYFDHLLGAIAPSETKVYLHLLPSAYHVDMPEAVLAETLNKHGEKIFGIINESGLSTITQDLIKSFANQCKIHSCNEMDLKTLHSTGTISVMANVIPRVVDQLLHTDTSKQGTFIPGMKAKSTDERLIEFESLFVKLPTLAAYKFLLAQIYHDLAWVNCRPPLVKLDQELINELSKRFKTFDLQTNSE
ncbi:MAG: dihydrodipicolinate synthase family protein [Betaproteobacteria bacterium]|jgi:4-hydroxy-tetrahydrodipicolinate synthase